MKDNRSKFAKLLSYRITATERELADHVRVSNISPELAAELHGLHDEVLRLASLIEFYANGVEYQLWKAGEIERATNG